MNLIVGTCCNTMQRNGVPLNLDSLMFGTITGDFDREQTYFDEIVSEYCGKFQKDTLTSYEIMRIIQIFRAEVRRRENEQAYTK